MNAQENLPNNEVLTSLSRIQNWSLACWCDVGEWPSILCIAFLTMFTTPSPALHREELIKCLKKQQKKKRKRLDKSSTHHKIHVSLSKDGSQSFYQTTMQVNTYTYYDTMVVCSLYLPAPTTTIFCFTKSSIGRPIARTAPSNPPRATPAVP